MTNPVRQEILHVLGELSEACPEVRFGQLLVNLSYLARDVSPEAIWEMEDEELLAAAKQHLKQWQSRRATPVS
jgi:hypothetical protein